MASERDREIWDDATNAVCQAMQEQKMCNCPDGDCLAAKIDFSPEKIATATRPAPAATDTGLETVEHQYWRDQTQEWLPTGFPDRYRKDGFQVRELVTRSQAESEIRKVSEDVEQLLAAKDEQLREINELLDAGQGDDDGAQILPDFEDGMSILGKVEACLALLEDRRDVIEGYEAKLAATEKDAATWEANFKALNAKTARAVLGGRPS
ncbi:hypothetical protein [Ochrobactrum sp. CGA5]|uniref:hypothetical protein n=1 Tax=Ochrobactrum sp. CGA5 TaxID=2583453 RepID=UPI00111DD4A1|nr:hypothetical protein [Ochrobactrum sp. CGA5]